MGRATFRFWRGDATGGSWDYTAEVTEGMVVLDAVHGSERPRPGPRLSLELQGRQVRVVLGGRDQRQPRLCMTRVSDLPLNLRHRRADAGVPAGQDLVTDVSSGKRRIAPFRHGSPTPGTWRMDQADATASRIPQVHRVLPLPGRLSSSATTTSTRIRRPRLPSTWLSWRCTARHRGSGAGDEEGTRHRVLQHLKCCTKVCPGTSRSRTTQSSLQERVVDDSTTRPNDPARRRPPQEGNDVRTETALAGSCPRRLEGRPLPPLNERNRRRASARTCCGWSRRTNALDRADPRHHGSVLRPAAVGATGRELLPRLHTSDRAYHEDHRGREDRLAAVGQAAKTVATIASARRWPCTNRPRPSGHTGTTMPGCGGTVALDDHGRPEVGGRHARV